ncbi:MAG: 50S ribosomal protein L22 [Deltaproteobacteria bacterium]|nr:50S ribosomal protein L22 [Deltaproteobacteria bacterium]
MEAKAVVRHVRMSPRKVRIVANMIRGKSVDQALGILKLLPKKSARVILKLVSSAAANAEDKAKGKVDVDALYIQSIQVDCGSIIKRWLPRAMGRANRIQRRTSHITVVVNDGA